MSEQNMNEQAEAKAAAKAAVLKKEKDGQHPASHYLVVEDAKKPSTWHLRVRDAEGNLDHRLMGAAWAALHQGYRGQRYEGPDKEKAIAKLKKLYEQEDMEPPGKSISLDEVMRRVRDAWYAQNRPVREAAVTQGQEPEPFVREVFDDKIIVAAGDKLLAYPYHFEDGEIVFGKPTKVEVDYKPTKSVAVKMLSRDDGGALVGGYLLLWGDPEHKDLQGDYFTPDTQLWLDRYPQAPALFHHGLDDTVGLAAIGHRVKAVPDDVGVWVEDWIDTSNRYWKLVEPLLEAERLFYSPGSAPHLVKRAEDGKLLSYPPIEDTLTPIPAQHRLRPVEQIKAAYKAAGLDLPDLDEEVSGDDGGPSCEPGNRVAVVKAKAKASALLARIRREQE